MPTHRRLTVCREGWCYAVVLALIFGALVRGVNLLVVLAGLLAGPLLLSRFMATFNLKGLLVRRKVPKGVCAGELLFPGITLSNPRRHVGSWAVVVEEQIEREGASQGGRRGREKRLQPSVFFPYLPARQTRKTPIAAGLPAAAAIPWGRCGWPRDFPSGCFATR